MSPKIHPKFWDLVGGFAPEVKLSAAWIMTNNSLHFAGVVPILPRRFKFDTDLEERWLEETLRCLASLFFVTSDRAFILIRPFIEDNYGRGEKLAANNIGKGVAREVPKLHPEVQTEIYRLYPELKGLASPSKPFEALGKPFEGLGTPLLAVRDGEALRSPFKGLVSPSETNNDGPPDGQADFESALSGSEIGKPFEALAKPFEGVRIRVRESIGIGTSEGVENLETAVGEGKVHLRFDLASELLNFLNEKSGAGFPETHAVLSSISMRLYETQGDFEGVKKMIARQCALWRDDGRMRNFLRPTTLFGDKFPDYFGQRDLPAENGARLSAAELRDRIEKSPANPRSLFHSREATETEKANLKKWRAELASLEGKS